MYIFTEKNTRDKSREVVLYANEDLDETLNRFANRILEHASNGDEYSSDDIEGMKESRSERVGPVLYEVSEVSTLTDEEIVSRGGGVCSHCHSDETNGQECEMKEGYIERIVDCNICGKETIEQYTLEGIK